MSPIFINYCVKILRVVNCDKKVREKGDIILEPKIQSVILSQW